MKTTCDGVSNSTKMYGVDRLKVGGWHWQFGGKGVDWLGLGVGRLGDLLKKVTILSGPRAYSGLSKSTVHNTPTHSTPVSSYLHLPVSSSFHVYVLPAP